MDLRNELKRRCHWFNQIGNLVLRLLWHIIHLVISIWYLGVGVAHALESYLISSGVLQRYKALDTSNLQYLAIVVDNDDACRISNVIQLLRWLSAIGVKHLCLYDMEGVLKKHKESILEKLESAVPFEEAEEKNFLLDKKHLIVEFASISDGKEAVAKAANILFEKYTKLTNNSEKQEEQIFTEAHMSDALRAIGCRGPEPDLLLVWGPARCHLGFPPWRMRYTEIVHMGPLKSMKYGMLIKAIYKFTMAISWDKSEMVLTVYQNANVRQMSLAWSGVAVTLERCKNAVTLESVEEWTFA